MAIAMSSHVRKFALTLHVTASVGWWGAVAAFLVLAVAGLTSPDPQTVQSAYLAMDAIGWHLIVPISFVSLLTGFIQSVGTEWGVLRHYWVLVKFLVSIGATLLLLVHMQPTDRLAHVAATTALASGDLHGVRVQLVMDAAGAVGVLLLLTMLSVYKPWGLTRYGWRRQNVASGSAAEIVMTHRSAWGRRVLVGLAVLVLLVLVIHAIGGGLGHHVR